MYIADAKKYQDLHLWCFPQFAQTSDRVALLGTEPQEIGVDMEAHLLASLERAPAGQVFLVDVDVAMVIPCLGVVDLLSGLDPADVALPAHDLTQQRLRGDPNSRQVRALFRWRHDRHGTHQIEDVPLCTQHILEVARQHAGPLSMDSLRPQLYLGSGLPADLPQLELLLASDDTRRLGAHEDDDLGLLWQFDTRGAKGIGEAGPHELLHDRALRVIADDDQPVATDLVRRRGAHLAMNDV
mmetsp:Transcript_137431/g.439028  ORF Transcript_137431/g.439028 Transcript_137431/m.439028 type:complete len:241 (+) Transcript_137431:289-1011(+)